MRKALLSIAIIGVLSIGGYTVYQSNTAPETAIETANNASVVAEITNAVDTAADVPDGNILVIEVDGENSGVIEIELNSEIAPEHAARLKILAAEGAYDNVVFHRVMEGFMAQTGDVLFGKKGSATLAQAGTGSSELPNLDAEFSDQKFVRGMVGMARSNNPNSGNSQFFIMFADAPHLNGQYTIVGKVVSGMNVVDKVKRGNMSQNGAVIDPDYMKSVRVKSGI